MIIKENIDMKPFSNMKVGGTAKELIYIEHPSELEQVLHSRDKYFIIGRGTNTLIPDGFVDISFISLERLKTIKQINDNTVYCQAGVSLDDFMLYLKEHNLGGIENLSGIPGGIGGLIHMNGGAYGTTIFDCIKDVTIYDPKKGIVTLNKEDINYGYRSTEIKKNGWIVLSANFVFHKGFDNATYEEKIKLRSIRHPLSLPNLGSTFKNPEGYFAAKLISQCGLQGYQVGDMQVSMVHPNFLVNKGNATYNDVLTLISHIKNTVYTQTGIMLETEIVIINNS